MESRQIPEVPLEAVSIKVQTNVVSPFYEQHFFNLALQDKS